MVPWVFGAQLMFLTVMTGCRLQYCAIAVPSEFTDHLHQSQQELVHKVKSQIASAVNSELAASTAQEDEGKNGNSANRAIATAAITKKFMVRSSASIMLYCGVFRRVTGILLLSSCGVAGVAHGQRALAGSAGPHTVSGGGVWNNWPCCDRSIHILLVLPPSSPGSTARRAKKALGAIRCTEAGGGWTWHLLLLLSVCADVVR